MQTIIVTGGAGYIGSHLVLALSRHPEFQKFQIVIIDNLESARNYNPNLNHIENTFLEIVDLRNQKELKRIFQQYDEIVAVFHFAALLSVGDSVQNPLIYWDNNVTGTQILIEQMVQHDVKYMVFSSTAAVYGEPLNTEPIKEDHSKEPINPYGETKLAVEKLLKCCDNNHTIKSVSLRYFNACGADASGTIGENRKVESHLIPLILQVGIGQREFISIYGNNYPTQDGTCIRDYIHVSDLASAHIKALEYLMKGGKTQAFNLGSGKGYSVQQIIEAARKVTAHEIPTKMVDRRQGDPAILVASSTKAESVLGWNREYDDIDEIIQSAWLNLIED